MNYKFIIMNSLIYFLFALTVLSGEGIPVHKLREAGDSLDISIMQELNRSADIGVQWIIARQNSNGSWGLTNQIETTAICILALASQNDQASAVHSQSAIQFLQQNFSKNNLTNFSAIAWTTAAFIVTGAQECPAGLNSCKIKNPDTPLSATELTLRREIILGLNLSDADESSLKTSQERYTDLTMQFNSAQKEMFPMWLDARVINREGNGQLITSQGQRIDWRRIFAQRIISSQKTDPQGGGFWLDLKSKPSLRNTALAILISKEL